MLWYILFLIPAAQGMYIYISVDTYTYIWGLEVYPLIPDQTKATRLQDSRFAAMDLLTQTEASWCDPSMRPGSSKRVSLKLTFQVPFKVRILRRAESAMIRIRFGSMLSGPE